MIAEFLKEWNKFFRIRKNLVEEIRSSQPDLGCLQNTDFINSMKLPEWLVSGLAHIVFSLSGYQEWQEFVPNLLDFPFIKPIFDEYQEEYKEATDASPLHRLLLRLLFALPVGMLKITAIDPLQMGRSLAPFLSLTDVGEIVPHKKFLTVSDEIESSLKLLHDHANDLMQKRFHGNVSDWGRYNEDNPDNQLPYHLLFIFGFPDQCSEKSILYLKRLIEFGPRCGILPIITIDRSKIDPKRTERPAYEIPQLLEEKGQRIRVLYSLERLHLRVKELRITEENESFPSYSDLMQCMEQVKSAYSQHNKFSKRITDMWNDKPHSSSSQEKISTPLGWTTDGKEVLLELGDKEHHVLLAGRAGSGG